MFIPAKFANTVNHAITNDTHGTIIHTNSGGFWSGLDYMTKSSNNKLFICEAGPLQCNIPDLIRGLEISYRVKCPEFIRNRADAICSIIGIPTDRNIEWHNKYTNDLKLIKRFVCLNSKNDNIIKLDYINQMVTEIRNDDRFARSYEFDNGTHWNISKTAKQKYQDILQHHINQIV